MPNQVQTGAFVGAVRDDQGLGLVGVTVTMSGVGATHLKAELEGFSAIENPNIGINAGRNTNIEITMSSTPEE